MQANAAESDSEREYNDELERWMEQHLDDIENLHVLLQQFKCSTDDGRRKIGHITHASLVRRFYEYGGPLTVVGVEYDNIEPKTDVDIRLSDDIYVQVWHGKMPIGHTLDKRARSDDQTPLQLDWSKEHVWVEKKLRQLPSRTGKGFLLNVQPGLNFPSPLLYRFCSPRKCVMTLSRETLHAILYGTADFMYVDEACKIAHALERPLRCILGDWTELSKRGRDPPREATYGFSSSDPTYDDLFRLRYNRAELLSYAVDELEYPRCDELENMEREDLFLCLSRFYAYSTPHKYPESWLGRLPPTSAGP